MTARMPTETSNTGYLDSSTFGNRRNTQTYSQCQKSWRKNSNNRNSFQATPETIRSFGSKSKKSKKSKIPNILCAPFSNLFREFIREMVEKILSEKEKATSSQGRKYSYASSKETKLMRLQSLDSAYDDGCSCSMRTSCSCKSIHCKER